MKRSFPVFSMLLCLAYLASGFKTHVSRTAGSNLAIDSHELGKLPVLANGRVKPLDTVARTSLLILRGKQTLWTDEGAELDATAWLLEVLMKPEEADRRKVFLITNPDLTGLFQWKRTKDKYFSFKDLEPSFEKIQEQAHLADGVEAQERSPFQKEVHKLHEHLLLYYRLKNSLRAEGSGSFTDEMSAFEKSIAPGMIAMRARQAGQKFNQNDLDEFAEFAHRYDFLSKASYFQPVPPADGSRFKEGWESVGSSLMKSIKTGKIDPAVRSYSAMVSAYAASNPGLFRESVAQYRKYLDSKYGNQLNKSRYEVLFNSFRPFYQCMVLYVLVFVLAWISWLVWPEILGKSALHILVLSFAVHTIGLVSRMWLQGRPPVTNLYSSAVFVGWASVLLGIFLERIHRNGIGSVTASAMGFLTLLVAHHLSGDGDTLEMMRAVLDNNFWLSTHVVMVTLGYASTFLAGFLAIVYIFRNCFSDTLTEKTAKSLTSMVYGIVCFATLFSFVGTILGGIWADQSWGRFWGWDPKENGALLIVLWNAIILHALWGKYIARRGLMIMAVFGNIVTSFSWFGVNMLGVGLHSYGFIDRAFFWLTLFICSQLAIMFLGIITPQLRRYSGNTSKPA